MEFQVLFKNLGVDLKEITPSSLLKDRNRELEGNPDFSNKDVGASQPQMVAEVKSGIISPLNQVDLPLDVAPSSGSHTHLLPQVCHNIFLRIEILSGDSTCNIFSFHIVFYLDNLMYFLFSMALLFIFHLVPLTRMRSLLL